MTKPTQSQRQVAAGSGRTPRQIAAFQKAMQPSADRAQREHEAFYAKLTAGQVVHYRNCSDTYVRCRVVVGQDGNKTFVPLELVGAGWKIWKHTAPYHQRKIAEGSDFKPHASCVWENNPEGTDPTLMGPINPEILN